LYPPPQRDENRQRNRPLPRSIRTAIACASAAASAACIIPWRTHDPTVNFERLWQLIVAMAAIGTTPGGNCRLAL